MNKKILLSFTVMMICFALLITNLGTIAVKEEFYETAINQHTFNLKVANVRGLIYDCRGVPLIGVKKKFLAAIVPSMESFNIVMQMVPENLKEKISKKFKSRLPFITEICGSSTPPEKNEDIHIFEIPVRERSSLAAHVIGYTVDYNGVSGIEKAYDDHLKSGGEIEIKYKVNASGKLISGANCVDASQPCIRTKGVMLELDKRIQCIAEEVAGKHLIKGAVIVTEIPNCEIRALISLPTYSNQDIKPCLHDANSPLMNRAFSSYNVGSIFKLVTGAAMLDSGFNKNLIHECKGYETLEDGKKIRCYGGVPHGKIDLSEAIYTSCNTYFIKIIKKINVNFLIDMAKKIGFGTRIDFAPGMSCQPGNLPTPEELENEKNAAIFSFGQGSLMAAPVQISGLINTIACNGAYSRPKLVKGLYDESMILHSIESEMPRQVISINTSEILKESMKKALEQGTGKHGRPKTCTAAAKTATAETGIFENNKRVNQAWYAGFFPFEQPRYCLTILAENPEDGTKLCAEVFKELAERIFTEIPAK
ncbi:MAG: penicillin-binding protein 2 [Oscillospiraceae bacterium]|nr:penicillin-binding protein 2 [Oscillospiraceae bacterium]